MMKLFIITGEYSGDKHAADIVKGLKALNNGECAELEIEAIGGENLKQQGVKLFSDHSKMSSVGISPQIIWNHLRLGEKTVNHLKKFRPDIVLLVDYGGFNLNISKVIKKELPETKIAYFIPPQIWASRKWRINTVKKYIDKVFCIFPFEKKLYADNGIDCEFVGHPLVHQIPRNHNKDEFFNKYNLDKNKKLVSIFPGSRVFEVKNLLKTFTNAAQLIQKKVPDTQFVIALAPNLKIDVIKKFLPKDCDIPIIQHENYPLLNLSDSLILASGTVALEAALYNTPMLISYKGPQLFYWIYLMVRCIKRVSLPNIIMHKSIIKELIQEQSTPEYVAEETIRILTDEQYRENMANDLKEVERHLSNLAPAEVVAGKLLSLK